MICYTPALLTEKSSRARDPRTARNAATKERNSIHHRQASQGETDVAL